MMDNAGITERIRSVKAKIEKLIQDGHLNEAKAAIGKFEANMPGDQDICSMKAVIHIVEGDIDKAEEVLQEGLKKDSVHFDLLYNLAYIYEQRGQFRQAAEIYCKAGTVADASQQANVDDAIARLKISDSGIHAIEKDRIVFFVKPGMDSFLGDITQGLSDDYFVRRIIVSDFKQIDEGMEWADICWFEWCDELVIYGSRLPLADRKKIICRLHSYEAFTDYINNVEWRKIDKVIFVADHIRDFVLERQKKLRTEQTVVIPNGIDPEKYTFRKGGPGFSVAYVGYLNYKKGPMLLLQTFKALYDRDDRYKLYIAGKFQDFRDELYFSQMVKEFGIERNVFFDGWQDDINHWLEDKNYILCTSLLESQNLSVMQAMCKGIKPVIHNFVGARGIYPDEYIWNTIDKAVEMVTSGAYNSEDYSSFIQDKYSLEIQLHSIKTALGELLSHKKVINTISEIINGEKQPEELSYDDLTVLIPCYNRARLLSEDLDRRLKLGGQRKVIVDDKSAAENDWLDKIEESKAVYNARIIRREINEGPGQTRLTGLNNIDTKLTAFVDDDDMLICLDKEKALSEFGWLSGKAVLLVPRYDINYDGEKLVCGYDRNPFNGLTSLEVLRIISSSGEISNLLSGGSAGLTDELKKHAQVKEFNVSEDFVMLSRLLSANPEKEIRVTGSLVHVRRISGSSLSKSLTRRKLALTMIAQAVGCYYCLLNGIADRTEIIEWIWERGVLLQKLYNFGDSMKIELIAYLKGEISEEVFRHFLELNGIKPENSLDELAPELRKMRGLFYTEKEKTYLHRAAGKLPLVSVIIPTYNRRDMLKRAIDQVLKQDYPNIELIVTDNCSEDGTDEMIRSRYKDEKRLIYHRNKTNIGPMLNTQNAFYNLVKGEFCLLLGDDDYLIDSSYISKAIDLFHRHSNLAFVYSGVYHNDQIDDKVYRVKADVPEVVPGKEMFLNFTSKQYPIMPNTNTMVFRRETGIEINFMKGDPRQLSNDLTILLRFLMTGDAGFIDSIALVYTKHMGMLSRNTQASITANNIDDIKKAIATAEADINELIDISLKAEKVFGFDSDLMDRWLTNRIWKYMYWRVNETAKTTEECRELLRLIFNRFPGLYDSLADVALRRFDRSVLVTDEF